MLDGLQGLDSLISNLDDALEKALDDAAEHAANVAKAHTKGTLGEKIKVVKTGKFSRELTVDAEYADIVENGRPGFSAKGRVLHFKINGQDIFTRSVGPAKPRPFMAPARVDLATNVQRIVEKALRAIK